MTELNRLAWEQINEAAKGMDDSRPSFDEEAIEQLPRMIHIFWEEMKEEAFLSQDQSKLNIYRRVMPIITHGVIGLTQHLPKVDNLPDLEDRLGISEHLINPKKNEKGEVNEDCNRTFTIHFHKSLIDDLNDHEKQENLASHMWNVFSILDMVYRDAERSKTLVPFSTLHDDDQQIKNDYR